MRVNFMTLISGRDAQPAILRASVGSRVMGPGSLFPALRVRNPPVEQQELSVSNGRT